MRVYRARSAPSGRKPRKPITQKMACATMYFSNGNSGMWKVAMSRLSCRKGGGCCVVSFVNGLSGMEE